MTRAATDAPILRISGVSKEFSGTHALTDVDLEIRAGEIHALLGENGAGKSTLVKIIGGVLAPDQGRMQVNGRETSLRSPADALAEGIAVVHQELSLMPNLTVGENLCMNAIPRRSGVLGRLGFVDRRQVRRRTERAGDMLGTRFNAADGVASLSPARRQLVEIGRALLGSTGVLLLDEPTSSLPPDERHELFTRLRELRRQGIGIVLVTHALEEALEHADRVTVLRDGRRVGTRLCHETRVEEVIEMMTGRAAGSVFPDAAGAPATGTPRLRVRSLSGPPRVRDVSFDVHPGEIVGLAGLVGSGRTETLKMIFGAMRRSGGTVELDGSPAHYRSTKAAIEAGLAYIPEDRQAEGLFPDHSVLMNLTIAAANARDDRERLRTGPFLDRRQAGRVGRELVQRLRVKTPGIGAPIAALSGGNQQKAILARWLAVNPRVVLADEPTRGVSVGSKVEIYRLLRRLAAEDAAVLVVSSEFEEIVGLCDRVVLMKAGRTVASMPTAGLDADGLLNLVLSS